MKKSVELPIVPPIYSVYHSQGSASAVLSSNPSARNWYLNHAIILSCDNRFLYSSYSPDVSVCHSNLDSAPYLDKRSVNTLYLNGYVHPVIRAMLDDGYYVYYTAIDDYYIKGKSGYGKWHFFHDGLICGYDQNEKTYSVFAYDENEHYTVFKTPQSGFEAGRKYVKKHGGGVVGSLCAIRPWDIQYELEPETVCHNLKDYLRLTVDYLNYDYGAPIFGVGVHDCLALYLWRIIDGKIESSNLDLRAFKMIYEHKTVMLERLQAIEHHLYWEPEYSKAYSEVVRIAEKLWHRCLYYTQTNRWAVLFQMRDLILAIAHNEAEVLENVVAKLENDKMSN